MDSQKPMYCALIRGALEELNRVTLKEQFSRFGQVTKIFIHPENNYAKVYLDTIEGVKEACTQLNGVNNWEVKISKDSFKKQSDIRNSSNDNLRFNQDPYSQESSYQFENMEQDGVPASGYVDFHGKPVEAVKDENGKVFVSLEDVKSSGFNIFLKSDFENSTFPRDMELAQLQNFLLSQGKNYIINFKKRFNESEMLKIFQRVEAVLTSQPMPTIDNHRQIESRHSGNISITTRNDTFTVPEHERGTSNGNNPRFQRRIPDNFQPAGSRSKNESSSDQQNRPRGRYQNNGPSYRGKNVGNQNSTEPNRRPRQFANTNNSNFNNRSRPAASNGEAEKENWEGNQQDNNSNVSLKTKSDPPPPINVNRVKLSPGTSYKVKVSYNNQEKPHMFYGQLNDNEPLLSSILCQLNSEDNNQPELVDTSRNTLCMLSFEDVWYRGVMLNSKTTGDFVVELLDYGNRETVSRIALKELSEDLKNIPAQAVRFTIHQQIDRPAVTFKVDDVLEIFIKKHFDDGTHLVEIIKVLTEEEVNSEPAKPPTNPEVQTTSDSAIKINVQEEEECFTDIPSSNMQLQPGESVLIINHVDNKLILRNKESGTMCKQIYEHLATMQKNPISNPKVGQLVLCSKDSLEGLHRGVIKKITDKTAEVEFIDYHDRDTLALKSLRNVDKTLASFPSATIVLDYPCLANITEEGECLLASLILLKKKVITGQVNGKLELLLTEENGDQMYISDKIQVKPKECPAVNDTPKMPALSHTTQAPTTSGTQHGGPSTSKTTEVATNSQQYSSVKYGDMPNVTLRTGLNDYVCYSCTGETVALVPMTDDIIEQIGLLGAIDPKDDHPFHPDLWEMCLAKFQDLWYRGLVTDTKGDHVREVLFVDYGNSENVNISDIRRFPEDLKEIPIISATARFEGIPDNEKVHMRIKELIPDQTPMRVNVVKANPSDLEYAIEVPDVYAELKKEGLI